MNDPVTTKRTPGQILGAALTGLVIGLAGGAALGAGIPGMGAPAGAIVGGGVMALVSGWADATRTPAKAQPLGVRLLASVLLAAVVGWLMELVLPDWPLMVVGAIVGVGASALGFRLGKLALGLVVGLAVGAASELLTGGIGWSVVSATTVLVYRAIASVVYRGREQVRFLAENAEPGTVPFVVPLAERQGYVGVDYLRRYAEQTGALFAHSPPDIGIVDSFDSLAGPTFDPDRTHPLVREFYEHTSRFALAIEPHWRVWMRLPYLVYRETVAKPLGQANAPFHLEEVQRGVVSWIDTIDVDEDGVPDFRAWVRAYEDSNEPLYVGIYTVVRNGDTAYVSVGFPLPSGSFTATLLPSNYRDDGLLLSSRRGDFPGHYLSFADLETGRVSVAELSSFDEEIEVFVDQGELLTDHRFFLGGIEFMRLHYEISRH
ncbi:MAG: hypothetical protein PVF87_09910 [Acidimicrobiia bacterium]|jgi:hypothetical protein